MSEKETDPLPVLIKVLQVLEPHSPDDRIEILRRACEMLGLDFAGILKEVNATSER